MVSVKYNGTLGNKMWQYASARIFCVNNNLTLNAEPVEHFINTNEKIIGKECNSHSKFINGHKLPPTDTDSCNYSFDGYFQRYENIKEHKANIRKMFKLELPPPIKVLENDIVLTIRRGWNNWPIELCPPSEVFINILSNIDYDRIILCTDTFDDEYFDFLKPLNKEVIFARFSPIEQFSIIKNSKKIILSPSTFSWWAAFLSDADEIYYPLYSDLKPTENAQNWIVDDEARYKYINL